MARDYSKMTALQQSQEAANPNGSKSGGLGKMSGRRGNEHNVVVPNRPEREFKQLKGIWGINYTETNETDYKISLYSYNRNTVIGI